MHPICCYPSSENINCHSIQAARKKYANNIKRALDFYYYLPFLYDNIYVSIYGQMEDLMHIYFYGVSINGMLISQLKRFLGVKFVSTSIQCLILCKIIHI